MKKKGQRWIGFLYAAVLLIMAAAGVIYCIALKSNTDPTSVQGQYAMEEDEDQNANDGEIVQNADAENPDAPGGTEMVDLGDSADSVPLAGVSGEDAEDGSTE